MIAYKFTIGCVDSPPGAWIHHWVRGFTTGGVDSPLDAWIHHWLRGCVGVWVGVDPRVHLPLVGVQVVQLQSLLNSPDPALNSTDPASNSPDKAMNPPDTALHFPVVQYVIKLTMFFVTVRP